MWRMVQAKYSIRCSMERGLIGPHSQWYELTEELEITFNFIKENTTSITTLAPQVIVI